MISHEVRMMAIKQVMLELRASGPCSTDGLRYALLVQVPGVTAENIRDVWSSVWAFVTNKRHPMVAPYDDIEDAYVVHPRMYDRFGNYKGDK